MENKNNEKGFGICVAAAIVFVLFTSYVAAQKPSVAKVENESDLMKRREIYEFTVGRQIDYSLMSECSVYLGVIEEADENALKLTVSERFTKLGTAESLIKQLSIGSKSTINYSPWANTDLTIGHQLLISDCRGDIRAAVSDKSLFESIRKVINFDQLLGNNPGELRDIPEILQTSKDHVFAGYAIDMLWRRNMDRDLQAIVLSAILAGERATATGYGFARVKLRLLLASEGESAISESARQTSLLTLMNGIVNGKGEIDEMFSLLCQLADQDKLELSSVINQSNRKRISERFADYQRRSVPSGNGQAKLREELNAK
jgi:hypothetical protein